jgi:hypothetical protein
MDLQTCEKSNPTEVCRHDKLSLDHLPAIEAGKTVLARGFNGDQAAVVKGGMESYLLSNETEIDAYLAKPEVQA